MPLQQQCELKSCIYVGLLHTCSEGLDGFHVMSDLAGYWGPISSICWVYTIAVQCTKD